MFDIKHQVLCENNQRCIIDIVNLTDVQSIAENKVQIYISGALHGNERLGPHASFYLIELLVTNFGIDPFITNLLKTREIIITPMTNAPGFFYNEREERMAGEALKVSDVY
jgi:predicted deacylase